MVGKPVDPAIRFWPKVNKTDGCWLWTASCRDQGYGQFYDGQRRVPAHRWAYADAFGAIPEGLVMDHLCRTPNCVNPAHLEPVTERENILRGTSPTAYNAIKTHCHNGHAFDVANTYIDSLGKRHCRTCRRARAQRYKQRRRQQARDHLPETEE